MGVETILPIPLLDTIAKKKMKDVESFRDASLKKSPEFYTTIAERKLQYILQRTYEHSIHFRTLVPVLVPYSGLPEFSKDSYIHSAPSVQSLCIDSVHTASLFVTSSGYSGLPCTWPKTKEEETVGRYSATLSFDMLYSILSKKTLIINCLALSSWIGGMVVSKILDHRCTVLNVGPVKDEVVAAVQRYSGVFDQIILTSYPPFITSIVEELAGSNVHVAAGGEGFTESWREYIHTTLGPSSKVYSAFAASDVGITGATETKESVIIRRLCRTNPALKKAIFGDVTNLPMLFQYNPTQYHISTNENGELLFTTLNLEVLLPVIKYNLMDVGQVHSYREMEAVLKQYGVKLDLKLPFPFLAVGGRSDGSINLAGTLVYPEMMLDLLFPHLGGQLTGRFHLSVDGGLNIDIEVRKTVPVKKIKEWLQEGLFAEGKPLHKIATRNPALARVTVNVYLPSEYPHAKTTLKNKYR